MGITHFEQLRVWKKAHELTVRIYTDINYGNDFNFKNQITRASISIANNIAEGFERESSKDFKNFLRYSKGSCAEVKSMIYLAESLKYIDHSMKRSLLEDCATIHKMIFGLSQSIKV